MNNVRQGVPGVLKHNGREQPGRSFKRSTYLIQVSMNFMIQSVYEPKGPITCSTCSRILPDLTSSFMWL